MERILWLTFANPNLHTAIVGIASPAHLHDDVAILQQDPLPHELSVEA